MFLITVAPEDLAPNPWNTNEVDALNMEKLEASLRRNGFVKPVLVREVNNTYQILGGEHRVAAARSIGLNSVPVLNLGEIDESKAKEIGLIDNARYGTDDALGLAELIQELGGVEELGSFMPLSDDEIASLSTNYDDSEIDDLLDEDDKPEPAKKPPAKTHQIMRFKVEIGSADRVTETIQSIIDAHEFDDSDSLVNAGDALMEVFKEYEAQNEQ